MTKRSLPYNLVKWLCTVFIKIFFPYKLIGGENLKNIQGPCVLCANHISNLDPIYLLVASNRQIHFMAKAELFKFKPLGMLLSSIGTFAVNRGKGDKKAISEAQDILRNEGVVGIFIEGTRSKTGEFLRPKSGAAVLAYTENVPVLPVCITGAGENNRAKLFQKTAISCGKPFLLNHVSQSDKPSISEIRKMSDEVMQRIKQMR